MYICNACNAFDKLHRSGLSMVHDRQEHRELTRVTKRLQKSQQLSIKFHKSIWRQSLTVASYPIVKVPPRNFIEIATRPSRPRWLKPMERSAPLQPRINQTMKISGLFRLFIK